MVLKNLKRAAGGILVASLLLISAVSLSGISVARGDTTSAVNYLKSKPINAWTAMALAAAGQSVDVSSLKTLSTTKATDYEAAIMALAAAGKDPRTYPTTDYVAALKGLVSANQIGDATILNDDAFGILALRAAAVSASDTAITDAKEFLLSHQGADGGWSFSVSGTSDTNTTAAVIMALIEAGVAKTDLSISKATAYLKSAQNTDGGFTYDPQSQWGTDSDASSDAWVSMAITKLGESPASWQKEGKSALDHLSSLQDDSGFFRYQTASAEDSFSPITTAYALIAVSGKTFPVAVYSAPASPSVSYRIAGKDADICSGEINAPNALELVKLVATQCNTSYQIDELSFGPYLSRIGNDTATGNIGWMYRVNYLEPSVGAADYVLKAGDAVLWYFADYMDQPTRITLTNTSVNSGSDAQVFVESYEAGGWQPLVGASVKAGNSINSTGADGKATITLPDGVYKVSASKAGYIRTPEATLVVGGRSENQFPLSVTLNGGSQGGGGGSTNAQGVSFVLGTPTSESGLSFGSFTPGNSQSRQLTITNTSQSRLYVEALVAGDEVFRNYLSIDNAQWRKFNDRIDGAQAKTLTVGLAIPEQYQGSGQKSGTLTIWGALAY